MPNARSLMPGYLTKPLLVILLLGFASGLPLALTASTLTLWLANVHIDKSAIGLFAAVATPYTLKFLWSPLLDSIRIPVLSRVLGFRRGWILLIQLALAGAILLMGSLSPSPQVWVPTALAAILVAFLSASQDIVIDAYRVEILGTQEQGRGAAMIQLGYRIGMLASGAGALGLSDWLGWHGTYCVMAALMGLGMLAVFWADEPAHPPKAPEASFTAWLKDYVATPFADFLKRDGAWLILLFVVTYKLADAFIGIMANPFFHELGFTNSQIGTLVKVYGTIATLLGTFLGGSLTARYGAMRILFLAGLLHALTNLLYVLQAQFGADGHLLAYSIFIENLTGGISAAAFVAYLSNLCNRRYTATQYALFSSIAALARTWLSTPAGWIATAMGWEGFFTLGAFLAAPGLILIYILKRRFPLTTVIMESEL